MGVCIKTETVFHFTFLQFVHSSSIFSPWMLLVLKIYSTFRLRCLQFGLWTGDKEQGVESAGGKTFKDLYPKHFSAMPLWKAIKLNSAWVVVTVSCCFATAAALLYDWGCIEYALICEVKSIVSQLNCHESLSDRKFSVAFSDRFVHRGKMPCFAHWLRNLVMSFSARMDDDDTPISLENMKKWVVQFTQSKWTV